MTIQDDTIFSSIDSSRWSPDEARTLFDVYCKIFPNHCLAIECGRDKFTKGFTNLVESLSYEIE